MNTGKLNEKEIIEQSKSALSQWKDKWIEQARINGEKFRKDGNKCHDLMLKGYGKAVILVGMGASLEDNIDIIRNRQNHDGVDIAVCDKGLGVLLDNGIKPKYVFLADAVVSYEKWCEKYIDQTEDIVLIANICSNPKWSQNWKGKVYYYINKDNIETEKLFMPVSGCNDLIPASSNVGNSLLVFSTQYLGYAEYYLVGFDYSWDANGNYYAFCDPDDKRYWMKHAQGTGINGEVTYTSGNLIFSCRWLQDFINTSILPNNVKVFNCSGRGILNIPLGNLEKKIKKFKPKDPTIEVIKQRQLAKSKMARIDPNTKEGIALLNDVMGNKHPLYMDVMFIEKEAA